MEIVASKSFGDYSAGLKWRAQKDYDRFQVPVSYKFGMFTGNVAPGYQFNNTDGGQDAFFMDGEPLQVKFGPVQLAYWLEYVKYTGDAQGEATEHDYKNQVRLRGTLYSTEDYKIGAEYRYQFLHDVELGNGKQGVENNRHIAILNAELFTAVFWRRILFQITIIFYCFIVLKKYIFKEFISKIKNIKENWNKNFYWKNIKKTLQ